MIYTNKSLKTFSPKHQQRIHQPTGLFFIGTVQAASLEYCSCCWEHAMMDLNADYGWESHNFTLCVVGKKHPVHGMTIRLTGMSQYWITVFVYTEWATHELHKAHCSQVFSRGNLLKPNKNSSASVRICFVSHTDLVMKCICCFFSLHYLKGIIILNWTKCLFGWSLTVT